METRKEKLEIEGRKGKTGRQEGGQKGWKGQEVEKKFFTKNKKVSSNWRFSPAPEAFLPLNLVEISEEGERTQEQSGFVFCMEGQSEEWDCGFERQREESVPVKDLGEESQI
jgi:hypothetical protein